jgi:thiol:disulfide interchange protein
MLDKLDLLFLKSYFMKLKFLSLVLLSVFALSACDLVDVSDDTVDNSQTQTVPVIDEATGENTEASDEEANAVVLSEDGPSFEDFSQSAYDEAIAAGKTVFIDFHANWCPTCRENAPKIEGAFDKTDSPVVGFRADYDTTSALQKDLGVLSQSTLILIPNGDLSEKRQLGPGLVTEEEVLAFLEV